MTAMFPSSWLSSVAGAIDHVALTVTRERSIEEVSIRRNVDQPNCLS